MIVKLLPHIIRSIPSNNVCKLILEFTKFVKDNYNIDKIYNRILNLLVDEKEYVSIKDLDVEMCKKYIHEMYSNIEVIEFLYINNITMDLYFTYKYTNNTEDHTYTMAICLFNHLECIK